jgi:3-hydroxyacyl-[acyl-carrier-protein] dehydratase
MRYLLVDRIEEIKKLDYALASKCISLGDDCFEYHYPGQPIYPGALLIETMAQLGGALIELSLRDKEEKIPRAVLSSVKAKFRDFVKPGDKLVMRAELRSLHEDSAFVRAEGRRGGEMVCQADIIYMRIAVNDPVLDEFGRQYLDIITREMRVIE